MPWLVLHVSLWLVFAFMVWRASRKPETHSACGPVEGETQMKCSACKASVSGVLACPACRVPFCAESCRSLHLCTRGLSAAIGRLETVHARRTA